MAKSYELSVARFRKIYTVWSLIGDNSVRLIEFIQKVKDAEEKKKNIGTTSIIPTEGSIA